MKHFLKRARSLVLIGGGVATAAVLTLGTTLPGQADIRTGVRVGNSSASDYDVTIQRDRADDNGIRLNPGEGYTIQSADQTEIYVAVYGKSFRVRYDKTSGAYQACQDIGPATVKTFKPSSTPRSRLDIIEYANENCQH